MTSAQDVSEPELPTELGRLASLIDEKPETFASGDEDIRDAALVAAKYIFDLTLKSESRARPHLKDLLESIGSAGARQTRAQTGPTAKKKDQITPINNAILNETPLSALFIDGMDDEQIWAQLELKAKNVCDTLEETFETGGMAEQRMIDSTDDEDTSEESELDSDELEELKSTEDLDVEGSEDEEDGEAFGEEVAELRDESSEEEDMEEEDNRLDLDARPSGGRKLHRSRAGKHNGLDDGFFSLADFNVEIEEAEAKKVSRGSLSRNSDEEESEDDNEIDYFTSVDVGDEIEADTGEAYYKDFFDPPPGSNRPKKRKTETPSSESNKRAKVRFNEEVKVKQIKARGKGLSLSSVDLWTEAALKGDAGDDSTDEEPEGEEEVGSESDKNESDSDLHSESSGRHPEQEREAIERVKDDLFADDDDDDDSGLASKSGLSTHEERMESLRKQIAELEAENVAEKDWVLKGEVSSKARPQNALLEEDLEFERMVKTVPVVTDEVVQDLETRIKARIIDGAFDDVVRKRPVDDKPFLPSQMLELQDTKSKESLAQIYENEYMATQTGVGMDDRDARLKKEHEEVEKEWESICYKLDALSNSHFTPKQPKAAIATIPNVSAISLESPLPTARAASTILAPEEVFKPGSTTLRSKSELTPAEKQALRTKERKKRKKQRQLLDKSVDKFAKVNRAKGVKKQKEDAMKSLMKSGKGVTVIGKKSQESKKGKRLPQK